MLRLYGYYADISLINEGRKERKIEEDGRRKMKRMAEKEEK